MNKIRVGILGATGYAGIELVRILLSHPNVEISYVVSNSYVGQKISQVYPHLKDVLDIECCALDENKIKNLCDVVFTALPHGASKNVIPSLYRMGLKIIDLSGDFRYDDINVYEKWYGEKHPAPDILEKSVYGLPELYRDKIKQTNIVGNPGCYTTCSILGLAPLLANGLCETKNIIIDAKSGVSGAGRSLSIDCHYCECTDSIKAYKVATHRHTSEIEQELSNISGKEVILSFTPHLIPMKRGILATCYANLNTNIASDELINIYKKYYENEYFIRIYENGLPETNHVSGSNFVDIGITVDKRLNRAVIVSCIDNLVKGASGQAVQNMNILFGLDEKTALSTAGFYL